MPGAFEQNRTMKAWVLHGINDLRYEDCEIPSPDVGEALVKVRAVGICGSDIPRIYKTGAHVHPIIPGHEFAGEVVSCKDSFWIGKRVGVFPLIPCGKCPQCRKQQYQLCRNYNYLGSRCDGGFAEYVKVPVWNLMELPETASFPLGACLEPLAVTIHAIRRAGIQEKDTVAVIGLGAIGMFVVAVLLSMGVGTIFAVGNKHFQREMVKRFGFPETHYYDYPKAPLECDVVLECVGKPDSLATALRCTAPSGRIVAVGNPSGDMALSKADYWCILRNQLTMLGTWNSSFTHDANDDWHFAIDLLKRNSAMFSSILSHHLPLRQLDMGLVMMREKAEPYSKVMMIPDESDANR